MNFERWLEREIGLESFRPGLDRTQKAIELFDLELEGQKIVTIGGTNGKGQTSRELYKLCLQNSSCALFTSPHLVSVKERFSKNGEQVEDAELEELFLSTFEILKKSSLKLSFYEFLFIVFLRFAREEKMLILETGLGGRLDAVNALNPDMVLLTSISRDHQEILGGRLELILKEKLALGRSGKILATNFELKYLRQITRQWCSNKRAVWFDLFEAGICKEGHSYDFRNRAQANWAYSKMFDKKFQAPSIQRASLTTFLWEGATCHALTSHNPDGVRKGVQFLKDDTYTNPYELVLMSFSNRSFADAMTMIKTMKAWAKEMAKKNASVEIALTFFEHPKAMPRERLEALAQEAQVKFFNDKKELSEKYQLPGKDILVLGSNYFIGGLRKEGSCPR